MLYFLLFAFAVILNVSFTTVENPEKIEFCQAVESDCLMPRIFGQRTSHSSTSSIFNLFQHKVTTLKKTKTIKLYELFETHLCHSV